MMLVGQERLVIPPGRQSVEFDSVCSSKCTSELLTGPVYIIRAFNHMHYLGIIQLHWHVSVNEGLLASLSKHGKITTFYVWFIIFRFIEILILWDYYALSLLASACFGIYGNHFQPFNTHYFAKDH